MVVRALYMTALGIGAMFVAKELGFGAVMMLVIASVVLVVASFVDELTGVR